MKAHDFEVDAHHDDYECSSCQVRITAAAVDMALVVSCPAGDCVNPANPDRGCVFAPVARSATRCVYCGRVGSGRSQGPVARQLTPSVSGG